MRVNRGAEIHLQPTEEQTALRRLWSHGRPILEQPVPDGLHAMEGTHSGAGEECEESSPEEGVAEIKCDKLTAARIPHPCVPPEERR